MSHLSKPTRQPVLPAEVWACLSVEHRTKAIRFMAELAFNLVKTQADSFNPEVAHVIRTDAQQNSTRPS